jgi:hypothetical protein
LAYATLPFVIAVQVLLLLALVYLARDQPLSLPRLFELFCRIRLSKWEEEQ